jgi:hypothetical protein
MIYADDFVERANIGWRIEQAQPDPNNPLLVPEKPWDSGSPCIGHGTVLKDPVDGQFKAWVVAIEDEKPREWVLGNIPHADWPHRQHEYRMRVAYYTSIDGVRWERPRLDHCPYGDQPKTNVLFYGSCGRSTYASVMIDPEDNPDEPYEMFIFHDLHLGYDQDTVEGFENPGRGLFRYRSRDGVHWRPIEGPTDFLKDGDGLYVFRDRNGGYRLHHKIGMPAFPGGYVPYDCYRGGTRTMWVRTSDDGREWSERFPILLPDWRDHPADQFMDLGYHPYGEGIIAILTNYHAVSQNIDASFAASPDGRTWWRPSRQPCLPNGPLGDIGGGMIWMTRELVRDGGRIYFYYGATEGIHGDIHAKTDNQYLFYGAFCRASWEMGRMWAAVPACGGPVPAHLTTAQVDCAGKHVVLNGVTLDGGEITVELLDDQRKPIPGFTQSEGVAFQGNEKRHTFRWQDGASIPVEKAHLRFRLQRARLYGYQLV